ncbi:MAG: LrgB family protein [Rhodocyclaceae bacterium]|nr:LrgB family protein [Rhodocyclaceae bacterium]MBX3671095.1 LrgB family protein [Rhodocyclaceae bacterium]
MKSANIHEIWVYLAGTPLLGLTATLVAYALAVRIAQRCKGHPLANPVLLSMFMLVPLLLATGTPYRAFFDGAQFVHFLLGPTTVALAVPLVRAWPQIRARFVSLIAALVAGSAAGAVSAAIIGSALGATPETVRTLVPKSVTTPIAMAIAERIGGLPALAAALVILTGVTGAVTAPLLFRVTGVRGDAERGFAMGVASHGIGTARALQLSETAGAYAALGMGLNGLASAVAIPLVAAWLAR